MTLTDARLVMDDLPCRPITSPPTLRQAVVAQLRDAIVAGELSPGTLLRETALAKSLGVSATPVREAVGELASEGLVEIQAHRLKRVTLIEPKAMRDLLRVQTELWRLGYIWGAPHLGGPELAALRDTVGRYRDALDRDRPLDAIRASHDFHTIVITASGNVELLRSTLDRRSVIARFILLHGRSTVSASGLRNHEGILQALKRGQQSDALARLERMAERLIALVAEHSPSDEDR